MKKLLIIGGTGFFGKSILDSFQRGRLDAWDVGYVYAMSRNTGSLKREAPSLLSSKVELISADIGKINELPEADIVIHAAASTDASRYLSGPLEERRNIQAGTVNYCRLASEYHSGSKLLYVSSGAVYGTQPASLYGIPEGYSAGPLDEIAAGKRDYAAAKRDAEQAVMELGRQQGKSVSIARCFAFVGAWLPRNQHFAIGNFIENGLRGGPITVKAKHPVYRSYMHADDLVDWLLTIAENGRPDCPIYNVGSDQGILLGDLAQLIAHEFKVTAVVPEITEAIIDRYVPCVDRAKNELGLQIRHSLAEAISLTKEKLMAG